MPRPSIPSHPPPPGNRQVKGYQQQLAGLHLRVDNLLRERQRMQEEAGDAAAAQRQLQAETAQLRASLAAAQATASFGIVGTAAGSGGGGKPGAAREHGGPATASSGQVSPVRPTARASMCSDAAAGSARLMEQASDEEVSWGRSLTARAPAARPSNVPPVDLSRLRHVLPARK